MRGEKSCHTSPGISIPQARQGADHTVRRTVSGKGTSATLIQEEKPVAHASRALTDAGTSYTIIEKEMLTVVFSLHV